MRARSEQRLQIVPALKERVTHLFVYSEIVESHQVGNAEANVLRVMSVPADGRMVPTDFTNPMSYNLSTRKTRFVKVFIADELGREIPFEH